MRNSDHFIFRDARRRWLTVAVAALASSALGFERSARAATQDFTLSAARINALLAASFPYTRDFSGLATLRLERPRMRFLPERDRLGTAVDFTLSGPLAGRPLTGALDLDYALRFDAALGSIRLSDVHLDHIAVDQLPPEQQQLVALYAPQAAQALLSGLVLYRLPASQLALMRDLGLTVRALRILRRGVRIELGPR